MREKYTRKRDMKRKVFGDTVFVEEALCHGNDL